MNLNYVLKFVKKKLSSSVFGYDATHQIDVPYLVFQKSGTTQ